MLALSSPVSRRSVTSQTTMQQPASPQQYRRKSSSRSLDGLVPHAAKSGVRPTSSSTYASTSCADKHLHHISEQQHWLIVLAMQIDTSCDVFWVGTGYAVGYATCQSRSFVQRLYRSALLALAAVLYVSHNSLPDHLCDIVSLLAVGVMVDVSDLHTDSISVLHRTMMLALIARMQGVSNGNWLISALHVCAFEVLDYARCTPMASANAVAMFLALVMPQPVLPFEALVRVIGACGVMYARHCSHMASNPCNVVHFFVAPWPVVCVIAVFQLMRAATHKLRGGTCTLLDNTILV